MPSLNRGRAIARFNEGKQCFEDMKINSLGETIVLDMVNGGGKSFLIQCLGQTIIPNSTWQKDWDFKAVFDPANKNTVVHCLTEWELDEGMGYKYLLAGFCASKPNKITNSDGESNYGDFDKFSYICLYNSPNENDIFNIPLVEKDENNSKKRMSLQDLKKYLKGIKGDGYYVELPDKARDYKKRLAQYNITNAEWELIRGVNADEKYVATYLRTFSTSEKFILKFLIPKIEECNANRVDVEYRDSEELARDLLNIRELMDDLIKKKGQAREYDKILSFVELVARKLTEIKDKYVERDALYIEIKKSIAFLEQKIVELKKASDEVSENIEREEKLFKQNTINLKAIEIYDIEQSLADNNVKFNNQEKRVGELNIVLQKESKKLLIKKKENVYHSILQDKAKKAECIKSIEALEFSNTELLAERNSIGQKVKNYLANKINVSNVEIASINENIIKAADQINTHTETTIKLRSEISSLERDIKRLTKRKIDIQKNMSGTNFKIIENTSKDNLTKIDMEERLEKALVEKESLKILKVQYEKDINEATTMIGTLKVNKVKLEHDLKDKNAILDEARMLYADIEEYIAKYEKSDINVLDETIDKKLEGLSEGNKMLSIKISEITNLITSLKSNSLTLSKDTEEVYNTLKPKYSDAILGKDFLAKLTTDEKKYFISINELVPYAILLGEREYRKFISDKTVLSNYFGGAIPIINQDSLDNTVLLPNGMTFTSKDVDFFVNADEIARIKREKEIELSELQEEQSGLVHNIEEVKKSSAIVKSFISKFLNAKTIEVLAAEVGNIELVLKKNEKDTEEYTKLEISITANMIENKKQTENTEDLIDTLKNQIIEIDKYIELQNQYIAANDEIKSMGKEKECKSDELISEQRLLTELNIGKNILDDKIRTMDRTVGNLKDEIDKISFVDSNDDEVIKDAEYTYLKGELKATIDRFNGINSNLKGLEEEIQSCKVRIEGLKNNIEQDGISLDELDHITLEFTNNSNEVIAEIQIYVDNLGIELQKENNILLEYEKEIRSLSDRYKEKIKQLKEEKDTIYLDIKKFIQGYLNDINPKEKMKEIKSIIRDSEKKISQFKIIKNDLEKELQFQKDCKGEFSIIAKDIDVDLEIDDISLDRVRSSKEIEKAVSNIKNSINSKKHFYKADIVKGNALVNYMQGFNEILEELAKIPNDVANLETTITNLIGKDISEDKECLLKLIKQEQIRLDDDIKSLELQEEKFVTLCIQQSENILRDIKKLADLSVIEINGIRQEMIKVNLTKLEDDIAKEKMKNYIEYLINGSGEYEDDNERRNQLSKGLTIEKLFQQIIKPIKASSIELYKLEDINNMEVNSWLNWDRAYGSKGQTNGMYISVLICLISYLRKLYTSSTDKSKKVIILDNPFSGTTSEIIWLPILKLLKENNVQLWAFGFEIKTQLSNCFNVRYFLKKEPGVGYEKIIVAKFKSNADTGSLGYDVLTGKKIEYTQQTSF
ncbi:hypothetical protein [Clostridium drakei]|uniref:Chromosome segregation ATPase n=1 Tax=Clostridium drakei TaxID=332101 RepID=A0A2U8DNW7_9CLOT|nr:hypothetical protein [Clostridium drakei]AWI04446.1 hypothetical protein B9W14_08045 [Clostridium drakei]